jgi:serine/threonine protein kinase
MTERLEQVQRAFTAYTVERELGSGGMATVYLAHDKKHDRKVAIKVLHAELAAVLGAERFLQEIRVTANLQHPHILGLNPTEYRLPEQEPRGPCDQRFFAVDAAVD